MNEYAKVIEVSQIEFDEGLAIDSEGNLILNDNEIIAKKVLFPIKKICNVEQFIDYELEKIDLSKSVVYLDNGTELILNIPYETLMRFVVFSNLSFFEKIILKIKSFFQ